MENTQISKIQNHFENIMTLVKEIEEKLCPVLCPSAPQSESLCQPSSDLMNAINLLETRLVDIKERIDL